MGTGNEAIYMYSYPSHFHLQWRAVLVLAGQSSLPSPASQTPHPPSPPLYSWPGQSQPEQLKSEMGGRKEGREGDAGLSGVFRQADNLEMQKIEWG